MTPDDRTRLTAQVKATIRDGHYSILRSVLAQRIGSVTETILLEEIVELAEALALPTRSRESAEVRAYVSDLRAGEENDGALESRDLFVEGRGISVLVNATVRGSVSYSVHIEGGERKSGMLMEAPAHIVETRSRAEAEAALTDQVLREFVRKERVSWKESFVKTHGTDRAFDESLPVLRSIILDALFDPSTPAPAPGTEKT